MQNDISHTILNIKTPTTKKIYTTHKEMFVLLGIRSFTGEQVHLQYNEKISSGKQGKPNPGKVRMPFFLNKVPDLQ